LLIGSKIERLTDRNPNDRCPDHGLDSFRRDRKRSKLSDQCIHSLRQGQLFGMDLDWQ
jgi:hypothetical protein